MSKIKIIVYHKIFNEPAIVLSKKLNIDLVQGDYQAKENDLFIVYGGHLQPQALLSIQKEIKGIGYIIMNTESKSSQFLKNAYYIELMRRNIVFDYSYASTQYLKEKLNIKVFSHFYFEFMKMMADEARTTDILFVGTPTDNRRIIEYNLKAKYPNKSIKFIYDWTLDSAEKMKNELLKAKIVLNINYYEDGSFETHRINNALSCGCIVVSHNKTDPETIKFYNNYIHFTEDLLTYDFDQDFEEKKPYEDMIKYLTKNLLQHNLFILNQLIKN